MRKFQLVLITFSANTTTIREQNNECNPTLNVRYFQVQCICHILNLTIQDEMKVFNNFIQPIRQVLCAYIYRRPKIAKY